MNSVHELERAYRERLAASPGSARLREVPWMLEELRVSHFAQSLGTRGPVSAKRIRRALEEAATDGELADRVIWPLVCAP